MSREQFVVTYAVVVLGTAVATSAFRLYSLSVLYSLYVIEFLVLLELLGSYKKSFRRVLGTATMALVLGFTYIIAQTLIQSLILSPAP